MPQDWDEWFRQAREEGMTRQDVREHLHQQGYDPEPLMQQYWPARTDDSDLQAQARDPGEREASMVQTTETHFSTLFTIFSSPSGFFRRIEPTVGGAGRFLGVNLGIFLLLGTIAGATTGVLFGDQAIGGLIMAGLMDSLVLGGQLLAGGLIITAYIYLVFGLLKRELSPAQTAATVMYASPVLLVAWIPIIGRFFTLYAFRTIKQGIDEQVETKGHSYTAILAPAALFAFIGLVRTLL